MLFDCIVTLYNLNNKSKSKQEFPKQDIRKLTLFHFLLERILYKMFPLAK